MGKKGLFTLVLAVIISIILLPGEVKAATVTNASDGDVVLVGKTVKISVKPGVATNHEDYCFLNVYDEKGNRIYGEDKMYSDMDKTIAFSFLLEKAGTYTVKTGTYYYYQQMNPISYVTQTLTSTSGVDRTISLVATTEKKIKADTPKVSASTNGSGRVDLSIEGLGNEFEVYRASSKNGSYTKIGTATGRSYTDDTVKQATYFYKVKGKSTFGKKTYSTKMSSAVKVNAKISAVKVKFDLKLDNDSKVVLTINSQPYATGYMIYRSTSKDGEYKLLKTIQTNTYTDTKVSGKKYFYKVKPYTKVNGKKVEGKLSVAKSITVNDPNKPGKPKIKVENYYYVDGSLRSGAVSISFKKVKNATAYKLYISTDGGETYNYVSLGWGIIYDKNYEGDSIDNWCYSDSRLSGKEVYFKFAAVSDSYQNGEYENFSDPVAFTVP